MPNNIDIFLVGCGYMAGEYYKVLNGMEIKPIIVGRSKEKCEQFEKNYEATVYSGGVENVFKDIKQIPQYAIVAASIEQLYSCTSYLLECGVKNILVEKPAGISVEEVKKLSELASQNNSNVFVAYNRRFYRSTEKALEIIKEDGGLKSFVFEFTEWESDILACIKSEIVRENILFANSSHVIDLAFYFGGYPVQMNSFVSGELSWHHNGCIYAGAGVTDKEALFSYSANWGAPGRWAIELMTPKHRLYFKPMEKLAIQDLNSVKVNEYEMDYGFDELYKPGLYEQVNAFLNNQNDNRLLSIQEFADHIELYQKIAGISKDSIRI